MSKPPIDLKAAARRIIEQAMQEPTKINLDGIPLSVEDWLNRDLPPSEPIMGAWLTKTSRVILNAQTGIGKTNFGMALFGHAGAGRDFLHWRCDRPWRALFIDGEMSRELFKERIGDMVRRLGGCIPAGLSLFNREDLEDFAPLNTPEGWRMIDAVIERIGGVDVIGFDNIMSLLIGDMKEEEPWAKVLPFVANLTRRNIGQIWVHHTGHDQSRGYGTKTREWRMDTILHLTEVKRPDTDLSFILEFHKARGRRPETRRDFEDVTIALVDDRWTSSESAGKRKNPSPLGLKFLDALRDALAGHDTTIFQRWRAVTSEAWRAECVRLGLIDPKGKENSARTLFNKYKRELIACNVIGCDNEVVWLQ